MLSRWRPSTRPLWPICLPGCSSTAPTTCSSADSTVATSRSTNGRAVCGVGFASRRPVRRNATMTGRLPCDFDELSYNVLHNRILKATMRRLIRTQGLAAECSEGLTQLCRLFSDIQDIELTNRVFGQVQLHRNNQFYDFLLKVCELIYRNLLVSEKPGTSKFMDFVRDKRQMAILFENFVRTFLPRPHRLPGQAGGHLLALDRRRPGRGRAAAQDADRHQPDLRHPQDHHRLQIHAGGHAAALRSRDAPVVAPVSDQRLPGQSAGGKADRHLRNDAAVSDGGFAAFGGLTPTRATKSASAPSTSISPGRASTKTCLALVA